MGGRIPRAAALVGAFVVVPWFWPGATPAPSPPKVRVVELAITPGRPVSLPFAASHVAVRWTGSEDAAVSVRVGRGRWQRATVAEDVSDARRSLVRSGLLRADAGRQVEVRLDSSSPGARRLGVVAIDAGRWQAPAGGVAGASVAQGPVISRAQWGADESMRRGAPAFAPVRRVAVHHTVTPNDDPDPTSTVRAIYAYHTQANGWSDIGYNFLVDTSGRIYEGRWARPYGPNETPTGESLDGQGVVGAHVSGNNEGTVGIAVLGTFTNRRPSASALDAATRLVAWESGRHSFDPQGATQWPGGRTLPVVAGHRDAGNTACPGDQLHGRLPDLRRGAAELLDRARSSVPPPRGYWTLDVDGAVAGFGGAVTPTAALAGPIAGAPAATLAATPSGQGYWLGARGGRVLPFGDAGFFGSPELDGGVPSRIVRMESTPSGRGYWILGSKGEVVAFGDAPYLGSPVGVPLRAPVVAMARTPNGGGYWVAAADGGVFAFGHAPFLGSAGGVRLSHPVVAVMSTADGRGYWLVTANGSVFGFGTARFVGSLPSLGVRPEAPIVQARATPSGLGYYLLGADGAVYAFGDAPFVGRASGAMADLAVAP